MQGVLAARFGLQSVVAASALPFMGAAALTLALEHQDGGNKSESESRRRGGEHSPRAPLVRQSAA
eukprot:COSAG01_NODE_1390_length_10496_cov_8.535116_12_plen_65_part_00